MTYLNKQIEKILNEESSTIDLRELFKVEYVLDKMLQSPVYAELENKKEILIKLALKYEKESEYALSEFAKGNKIPLDSLIKRFEQDVMTDALNSSMSFGQKLDYFMSNSGTKISHLYHEYVVNNIGNTGVFALIILIGSGIIFKLFKKYK